MAMPATRSSREYDKFVELPDGSTAVRTTATISGDVNVDVSTGNVGAYIGKATGTNGDFTADYAGASTITLANYPAGLSGLSADDIVAVVQIDTTGAVVETYTRDDAAMSIAAGVLTVTGATFAATDTFVVYTSVAKPYDGSNYDSGPGADKTYEIAPIDTQWENPILADVTNAADGTYSYYVDMDGYRNLAIQYQDVSGGSGTATLKIYASITGDVDITSADYIDVTTSWTGAASYTSDALLVMDSPLPVKYVKVEVVASTGGADDADWFLLAYKQY